MFSFLRKYNRGEVPEVVLTPVLSEIFTAIVLLVKNPVPGKVVYEIAGP